MTVRQQSAVLVVDREAALQRFGGNAAALKRSSEEFLQLCPERLGEIRKAIVMGDAKALRQAAYRMGWDLSRLSAGAAHGAALRLEQTGREGDLVEAARELEALERELGVLATQLRVPDR